MSRVDLVYRRHDIRRYGETGLGRVKSVCWGRARARAPRRIFFGLLLLLRFLVLHQPAAATTCSPGCSRTLDTVRVRYVLANIAMRLQREGSASVYDFAKTRAKK